MVDSFRPDPVFEYSKYFLVVYWVSVWLGLPKIIIKCDALLYKFNLF